MINITDKKVKRIIAAIIVLVIVLFLSLVIFMDVRSTQQQQDLLEESIKGQLLSITYAAQDMLDIEAIVGYNTQADIDADMDNYCAVLESLRNLAKNTGAQFIYVMKYIDGELCFLIDTDYDTEPEDAIIAYEGAPVHHAAFGGTSGVDVMNVSDEYGSYNTAAIPIYYEGEIVAVLSTDIADQYLRESSERATRNQIILFVVVLAVLLAAAAMIMVLLSRVGKMQERLSNMARRDAVTGLPNRQYLIEYLQVKTRTANATPFAIFFIDLDNFKKVNDTAGHDAGDALLRQIAEYLESGHEPVMAFRPAPGKLNVAARIGGDEFVLVLDDVVTEEVARDTAKKLLEGFTDSGHFTHYQEKYALGMSIGVSLYPLHSRDFNVLIKYADIAMYHAKHGGKNDYRVYEETLTDKQEK